MSPVISPSGAWVGETGGAASYFLGERSPHTGDRPKHADGGYPFHHPLSYTMVRLRPPSPPALVRPRRIAEVLRLRDQLQAAILRLRERTRERYDSTYVPSLGRTSIC